jgi:VanZ like family/Concanavalin A-like lectin/glucanases superfamily
LAVIKFKANQILGGICVLILGGVLTACLWPFHAPTNHVAWLASGLLLGHHGTVLSAGAFPPSSWPDGDGRTVEVWLQPTPAEQSATILAFYAPGEPRQFSLYQTGDGLALQTELKSARESYNPARLAFLPRVFQERRRLFVSITLGPLGTAAYVDGALVSRFPGFRPRNRAFTGRLVLGTSPVANDSWSGHWFGLAIYNRELTPAQVRRHYESWTTQGRPEIHNDERGALFLFDERGGNIVHNLDSSGINLRIPEKYTILNEKFLEPAWAEFRWDWSYWKSALINIAGFIPLGFFFYAYFSSARHLRQAGFLTVILAAVTSLTVEVLQAFLPTRDSGTTDVITNTLGACLGILLYRWKPTLINQALNRLPFSERLA